MENTLEQFINFINEKIKKDGVSDVSIKIVAQKTLEDGKFYDREFCAKELMLLFYGELIKNK